MKYSSRVRHSRPRVVGADQSVVTGPDLKELQEDYKNSQTPTTSNETETASQPTKPAAYVPKEPVTFVRPQVPESAQAESEEESDEDEDGIKGVYFENDDGKLAEYVE